MFEHVKPIPAPPGKIDLSRGTFAARHRDIEDVLRPDLLADITRHLGGEAVLNHLVVHDIIADHESATFRLGHANPLNVRTVVITVQPNGLFNMDCYGPRALGALSAPLVAAAKHIVPENLATVLGQLTGLEEIHHRHF